MYPRAIVRFPVLAQITFADQMISFQPASWLMSSSICQLVHLPLCQLVLGSRVFQQLTNLASWNTPFSVPKTISSLSSTVNTLKPSLNNNIVCIKRPSRREVKLLFFLLLLLRHLYFQYDEPPRVQFSSLRNLHFLHKFQVSVISKLVSCCIIFTEPPNAKALLRF